jgi:hypothetical protein
MNNNTNNQSPQNQTFTDSFQVNKTTSDNKDTFTALPQQPKTTPSPLLPNWVGNTPTSDGNASGFSLANNQQTTSKEAKGLVVPNTLIANEANQALVQDQFIGQQVLTRLFSGQFVPKRKRLSQELGANAERRRMTTPLAITKRCIQLSSNVFNDRLPELKQLTDAINTPYTVLFFVDGACGTGKTTLVRGAVELMGHSHEQALWFEIAPYAQALLLCKQLLNQWVSLLQQTQPLLHASAQYSTVQPPAIELNSTYERERTFNALTQWAKALTPFPLLIVLDNLETFVNPQNRLEAPVLKETLNFLLQQPNVKLVIIGQRLPLADLKTPPQALFSMNLTHLPEVTLQKYQTLLTPLLTSVEQQEALHHLVLATEGQPWLFNALQKLCKHHPQAIDYWHESYQQYKRNSQLHWSAHQALTQALADWLLAHHTNPQEQLALKQLAFVRHSIHEPLLAQWLPHFEPHWRAWLQQSSIAPLLKRHVPPQTLLDVIESTVHQPTKTNQKATLHVSLYLPLAQALQARTSLIEKLAWHQQLADFYQQQANLYPEQRLLPDSDTLAITREARYHRDKAQKLQQLQGVEVCLLPEALNYQAPPLPAQPLTNTADEDNATNQLPSQEEETASHQHPPDEQPYHQALASARQHQDIDTYFDALQNLIQHRLHHHRLKEAHASLKQWFTMLKSSPSWVNTPLSNAKALQLKGFYWLAQWYSQRGHTLEAFNTLKRGEPLLSQFDQPAISPAEEARYRESLFEQAHHLNNLAEARYQAEALLQALPVEQVAWVSLNQAEPQEALEQKQTVSMTQAKAIQGHQAQPHQALNYLKQAYQLFLSAQAYAHASQQLGLMAQLFNQQFNDLTKARHCLERAKQLDTAHNDVPVHLQNRLEWALLLWEEGSHNEAEAYLQEGFLQAQALNVGGVHWQLKYLLALIGLIEEAFPHRHQECKPYLQQAYKLGQQCLPPQELQALATQLANYQ